MRIFRVVTIVLLLFVGLTSFAQDSLRLEKVVVVSRHGLRAPLKKYFDTIDSITPGGIDREIWNKQGVKGGELTLKGVELENLFGNYFRLWLDSAGFKLRPDEVYFGASSKQRTVATSRAFAAGMLPTMMVPVHFRQGDDGGYDALDENYLPLFNDEGPKEGVCFDTVGFQKEACSEVHNVISEETPSYRFLEEVLQYKNSDRSKTKGYPHFGYTIDVRLDFYDKNKKKLEPQMVGDLYAANTASDALILLYYEDPEYLKSRFNRTFSFDDMCQLASVKDTYGRILFTAPIVAVNVSHCMLKNIFSEMNCNIHRFTFLCTHDSMIQSLLAALDVEEYELKKTIEKDTPIGVKFLLEKWVNPTTCKQYIKARLLYQSTDQIQKMQVLDLEHRPQSCTLSFTGLKKEENGMYEYDAFMNHIEKTLEAYKRTAVGKHPFRDSSEENH